jgi:outer membrane protein insertion porin family
VGACREEQTVVVRSLKIDGAKQVAASRITGVLVTKQSSRLPWGRKRYFDRARFDADLKRIVAFYADRGFPDARVQSVDVNLNDAKTAVAITIRVTEGKPIIVDSVQFKGFDVLSERVRRRMERTAPLKQGAPLDRQVFVGTRETLSGFLKDHGYPYGSVEANAEPISGDRYHTAVTYTATPGALAHFGDTQIKGNQSVNDSLIRRQLTFKPGDMYRRSIVQDSQSRLYGMELFEFANITPAQAEGQPTTVPMLVTVAEGNHRRVNFGVGYGTEEKARVDAKWRHVNFFGGARTAGIAARWSSLDRGVKLDFTQPYFLGPHFSLGFSGQAWNTAEPAYSISNFGGRATLTHRGSPRTQWSVSFVDEYQRSAATEEALADLTLRDELIALGLDPTDGTQAGTLIGFEFDIQRNTTRNLLDARRGYYAALHLEQSGGWLPGAFDYYMATSDLRHYHSFGRRLTVATRVQIGSLVAIGRAKAIEEAGGGAENIPFSKRFFLGGSTSLRGWGRFDVAPLSESGLPVGGRSMLEMTSELRIPVTASLSVVAFVDAGNVWADSWQYKLHDLLYDVGPGIRYKTPIGPIRADFGYQLTPIDGLLVNGEPERRHWRVHFSIGQAF